MSEYLKENYVDWEYITSPIVLAATSKTCQRSVTWKTTAINFINNRIYNCMKLSNELREGSYKKRKPKKFNLNERGKIREISPVAFRDRIVEKSLCENCLVPLIMPRLISSNCASLPGRGLSLSKNLFTEHIISAYKQYGSTGYFVKIDYSDYFHSINNDICFSQLERIIWEEANRGYLKDKSHETSVSKNSVEKLLMLLKIFIYDEDGLGLGNQTSQTAAIYYPHIIDNWCYKRCNGLYGRYMDDSYGFVKCKDEAKELIERVKRDSAKLELCVSKKKTFYTPLSNEMCWLKDRYSISDTSRNKQNLLKFLSVKPIGSVVRYGRGHLKRTQNVLPRNEWLQQRKCWESEIEKRRKLMMFL